MLKHRTWARGFIEGGSKNLYGSVVAPHDDDTSRYSSTVHQSGEPAYSPGTLLYVQKRGNTRVLPRALARANADLLAPLVSVVMPFSFDKNCKNNRQRGCNHDMRQATRSHPQSESISQVWAWQDVNARGARSDSSTPEAPEVICWRTQQNRVSPSPLLPPSCYPRMFGDRHDYLSSLEHALGLTSERPFRPRCPGWGAEHCRRSGALGRARSAALIQETTRGARETFKDRDAL